MSNNFLINPLSILEEGSKIFFGIDEVLFKRPVKVKEHIKIYGKVLGIGKSSIKIFVEARRVDFEHKAEELVCSTEMLFVRIDEEGNAIPIKETVRINIVKNL